LPISSLCPAFLYTALANTEFYSLSLHDALPISVGLFDDGPGVLDIRTAKHNMGDRHDQGLLINGGQQALGGDMDAIVGLDHVHRSEEHTSELQSREKLVCRLLLEKKKNNKTVRL